MKCPKCGSEYKTGGTDVNGNAVCKACQLKELKDLGFLNDKNIPQTTSSNKIIIETEITTAEMLLWLVEHGYKVVLRKTEITLCYESILYFDDGTGAKKAITLAGIDLNQSIKTAYEWAIKEKQYETL